MGDLAGEVAHSHTEKQFAEYTERNRLIARVEYILEASGTEGMTRRSHLTNHDLRCILAALKGGEHE